MLDAGTAPGALLPRDFFARPALDVAARLLGTVLAHRTPEGLVAVMLTEVEAYEGRTDPASHAYRGRTARNAVMFGPPGHAYVYFTYGMHFCVNLVCLREGTASAVLLRAGRVIEGVALASARRPAAASERDLARGPARLCQALGITRAQNGLDVCDPASPLQMWPSVGGDPVGEDRVGGDRVGGDLVGGDAEGEDAGAAGGVAGPAGPAAGAATPAAGTPPSAAPTANAATPGGAATPGRAATSDGAATPGGAASPCGASILDGAATPGGASIRDGAAKPDGAAIPGDATPPGVASAAGRARGGLLGPGISQGPRVGVSAAADRPWRFWLTADPTVSAYRPHTPRRPRRTADR